MKALSYLNRKNIYAMICSFMLVIFIVLVILNSSIVDHFSRKVEKKDLYIEWYKLMIDEPHKMIDIKQETISDFSIHTKYIFYSSKEKVIEEYVKLLTRNGWIMVKDCEDYLFEKKRFKFSISFNGNICEIQIKKE